MNKKYWIWLLLALKPANVRIWQILNGYDDIEDCYHGVISGRCNVLTSKERAAFKVATLEKAEEIIKYCDNHGMKIITFDDEEEYPVRLREIYNPPSVLFCYGNLSSVNENITLAVVGTRNPSDYSIKIAEDICDRMVELGTVLVSGFAYGIDSIAHKSCLKRNSSTIAVLGCGLDYDYPEGNSKFKSIIAKRGAVVTEYFPGTKPYFDYFKQRNRIVTGLSQGLLIVQAGSRSGTLNSASHALSQGRDIFCVPPHDVYDDKYAGVVNLLRDGAIPVFSHLDLVYEYYENFSHKLNYVPSYKDPSVITRKDFFGENPDEIKVPKERKTAKKAVKSNKDDEVENYTIEIDTSNLEGMQKDIVTLLKTGELRVDDLALRLDLDIGEILSTLSELEVEGIVKVLPGNKYTI